MKGAFVLLQKNGVMIRTQYTAADVVRWMEGEESVSKLLGEGYEFVKENLLTKGIRDLETLRDHLCEGYRVSNIDLLDIIKILKDY